MWVAPAKGSGCVRLSAMIYEGKDAWYADAGGLSKIICERKADGMKKALSEDECCACDEAKYNVRILKPLHVWNISFFLLAVE
jgi:spondin-1